MRRRDGGHGMWNLVLLCRDCHHWVHVHPQEAREHGYIISAHMEKEQATTVPLINYRGTAVVLC